jgi:hypothetical protein
MHDSLVKDAILRIGEVSGIDGRKVSISVDKNKNSSDLLFDGEIIKNIAVGSYIEVRKGFLSIIGKADGEKLREDSYWKDDLANEYYNIDKNSRVLTISLCGYIGPNGRFIGGIKELPLIGNEAYILTDDKIHKIHNLIKSDSSVYISVAETEIEEVPVDFPVDGLFNSHIAIFGNTGSGKSNTLASLYQELFTVFGNNALFKKNCRFLLLDFNGEYNKTDCITPNKTVYNLSTRKSGDNAIPISMNELLDVETLSVLVEATEKTQKPFLKRALRFYKNAREKTNYPAYLNAILQNKIKDILRMANKDVAFKLLDYMEEILGAFITEKKRKELLNDIDFHTKSMTFYKRDTDTYFNSQPDAIEDTNLYKAIDSVTQEKLDKLSPLDHFRLFLHLQLAGDLFQYKVQNDHIYPVINRFQAKQQSIERTFEVSDKPDFWGAHNFVVVNLRGVNLDMRKTIPLLLAKNIYNAHKREDNKKTLNIVIDEAHNILSTAVCDHCEPKAE